MTEEKAERDRFLSYVETLRAEISQLRQVRDHLDEQNRTLLQQKNAVQADLEKWKLANENNHNCYRDSVRAQDNQRLDIIGLKQQLTESQAREAVMRAAINVVIDWDDKPGTPTTEQMIVAARTALSTDAGASFLAHFREMRTLLDVILDYTAFIACPEAFAWQERRDAVLEATKGI